MAKNILTGSFGRGIRNFRLEVLEPEDLLKRIVFRGLQQGKSFGAIMDDAVLEGLEDLVAKALFAAMDRKAERDALKEGRRLVQVSLEA